MDKKSIIFYGVSISIIVAIIICFLCIFDVSLEDSKIKVTNSSFLEINDEQFKENNQKSDYIKWVDFNIPYSALQKSLNIDIKSYDSKIKINWIEILSYLGSKYAGDFKKYNPKDMDILVKELKSGKTIEDLNVNLKNYNYFYESYSAILGGMVGEYQIENKNKEMELKYGLKSYSPIAYEYNFNHYDDFGNSRAYGFKRKHLGNDLIGNIGVPIISVESGYVENIGWNKYGGWRIGIRSLDKKRYYYYAHLRKDIPYIENIKVGDTVMAGDVIGYLGSTGYSEKENVNGMKKPHLHFGMQIIFDESQKEGNNEIWIDVYQIIKLLEKHKSPVVKIEDSKQYHRKYKFIDPLLDTNN